MTESTCHSDKGGGGNYWRFMAMVSTSTVIMFFLMYANSFDMDDVFWSETRFWMMFVMGAMMMVVMLWTCNGFVPVTYLIKPPWLRMRAG